MTTLLLVRHGETHWNREGRVQGWAATGLTDRGREQARALGAWLGGAHTVDRVLSSDLERTRATTAAVRETADGLPSPAFDPSLRERGFGVYQGFLAEEMADRFPDHDRSKSFLTLAVDPLNGESVTDFRDRVERAWDGLTDTVADGETAVAVTHGGVLKLVRAILTARDPQATLAQSSPPNCSVTEVGLDGTPELVRYGATPWRD
ncbi:histidine phosphatase family protein [Haloarcula salinisoli]|uniref:Histidine phosphatase family protein n=1 Tax=Haloarcula salinisoli TaxID=2487746 RepID=A0A8J7YM28_9EURY|nr:histidine phosphatase family protein [Halomicroarcula salinisoli]MBX0286980.1 histidine phosphatase family protein [Halomicroarcula salinisoli]MBX0304281.1 histidine phosphatase family protein [Halomicroarcula salinisoli]